MWTCDVATKLTDFKIFNLPSDTALSAKRIESFDLDKGSHAYRRKYTPLLQLMDDLEPNELRGFSEMFGELFHTSQFFQWRAVLLYFAPEAPSFLAIQELIYRHVCLLTLRFCDLAHKPGPPKDLVIFAIVNLLTEVPRLRRSEELDSSSADHLEDILRSRLKILCAIVFHPDQFDANKNPKLFQLGMLIARREGLSYLPPRDWGRSGLPLENGRDVMSAHSTATRQYISSCLLSRPESSEQGPNASKTDGCCCGLVFDNIPTYLLIFFPHSLGSFMRCVHGRPGPTNWVFRQLEMKENLPQKMAILRESSSPTAHMGIGLLQNPYNDHRRIFQVVRRPPEKSDSNLILAGSVLVSGREQLLL
jgi:hypothetical protein